MNAERRCGPAIRQGRLPARGWAGRTAGRPAAVLASLNTTRHIGPPAGGSSACLYAMLCVAAVADAGQMQQRQQRQPPEAKPVTNRPAASIPTVHRGLPQTAAAAARLPGQTPAAGRATPPPPPRAAAGSPRTISLWKRPSPAAHEQPPAGLRDMAVGSREGGCEAGFPVHAWQWDLCSPHISIACNTRKQQNNITPA